MTVGMKEIDANDSTSPEGEMSGTRRSIGKQYVELEKWLEKKENKEKLKPPVCNTMLFGGKKTLCERKGQEEMQVMLVGGPNTRSDYHIELGSEFFYQVEGTLRLWVQEYGNTIREVTINAGQVFMLPACVPHSPNREKVCVCVLAPKREEKKKKSFSISVCRCRSSQDGPWNGD